MPVSQLLKTIGTVAFAGALIVFAIEYCPIPWAIVFLIAAVLLVLLALRLKRAVAALLTMSAVFVAFALFETYLGVQRLRGDGTRIEGSIETDDFYRRDDMLGYAPNRNMRVTARKLYADTPLYDVVYTIDANGLRIAPPVNEAATTGCIVFFGNSMTFGEGVNDDETFPYQAGRKTHGQYAIYNFGFSGYGPHQMLAALQTDTIERIVNCKPSHFIYLGFAGHISRVAGLTPWDKHGPRFTLDRNGTASRTGHFDSPHKLFDRLTVPQWVEAAIDNCFSWQIFFGRARAERATDLRLFLEVVRESIRLARSHYPDSEFYVLLWDGPEDRTALIESELHAAGISSYRPTSAIPDFKANWTRYVLSVHDMHPNALAHERLADFVVTTLLAPSQAKVKSIQHAQGH